MSQKPQTEASNISVEGGEVLMDGPDGVAVSFTADAAIETSERLLKAGLAAKGQQLRREQGSEADRTR